ncbi:uncharacterized protein wu:fb55g09 [Thalassophryne amazonica]|uniref:uncharacterized protein wu:fb55g09 n=1 Tax=Thalassophryne amazonica TaxID=390379 RepID=UPI001470AB6D|nr:uncharacterized protein wu:fb55g09 [Thalassophryne amazonica]
MVSEGGVTMWQKNCQKLQRTHRWPKSCRGRSQGKRTGGGGCSHHPQHHHRHAHQPQYLHRPGGGAGGIRATPSLRPVNVKGNRARGMRAPKNTNQFLMHEKYQLLHMRSDSVGSDSGSDSDLELTDMDSYLCVLENARGALLDCPSPPSAPGHTVRVQNCPQGDQLRLQVDSFHLQEGGLCLQEDSLQYFPSEDDLIQSQNFMQRDFVEFCDFLTA